LKINIEITLEPIGYENDISDLAGYLQMVGSELTNARTFVQINDYDFTDKVSVFKGMRRPSSAFRDNSTNYQSYSTGTPSAIAQNVKEQGRGEKIKDFMFNMGFGGL
tara:strand:+ start:62 stop:382 length:321 start_codon:yes stop_codon:yes gene_type:complete